MGEKKSVISQREITYDGIFSYHELISNTDNFMSKRNYSKKVKLHAETVKPKGKFIKMEMEYKRVINEYAAYLVKLEFQLEHVKNVEVVREGHKRRLNKGKIKIEINSWVMTDYESYWQRTPAQYIFRRFINKFFLGDIHDKWVNDVKTDVTDYINEITSYLNLQNKGESWDSEE